MFKQLFTSGALLLVVFGTQAFALDGAGAGDAATAAATITPNVDFAIQRVYPTLVQIHVLVFSYDGGRERKFEAAGSGAIITADGYVVTNHHVAGNAAAIRCVLPTKEELEAKLVGTDALADIAVLKLDLSGRAADAPPIPFASFGKSADVRVGDVVLAMGCPLALSQSVTKGIVANVDMMMSRFVGGTFVLDGEDVGSLVKWIGHDAQIQGGNSGGPLVNLAGEIIGINEIGVGTMSGAIPSDVARVVVKEMIENGRVRRPWVGATFQPLLKSSGLKAGVLLSGILPSSPAERAGLQAGDVILSVNGTPVAVRFPEEIQAFNMLLLSQPAGETITFEVQRGGQNISVPVETELRDDARSKEHETEEWGLAVQEITTMLALRMQRADKSGVLVGSVRPGGSADQAQPSIQGGDVIVEVGGKPVPDLKSFLAMTAEIVKGKGDPVPTIVAYERRDERFLTVVEVGIRKPQPPTPEARKPWFPAATQVLSRKLAEAVGHKGKKGVRITQIYPRSSVEAAGFQVGDIITHLDGQVIDASEPQEVRVFPTMIRTYKTGANVEFSVIRGSEKLTITMELGQAPKPERELAEYEDTVLELKVRDISYFDRITHRWSQEESGAMISQVESGGWAAFGGLEVNDLIQELDGKKITQVQELEAALKAARESRPKRLALKVKRGINTLYIELEPTWPEGR